MLKQLAENKLSSKFIIIQDKEDVEGQDLFISFLKSHCEDDTIKKICLISYENPSETYIKFSKNEKILSYNLFKDPFGWDSKSNMKTIWSVFDEVSSVASKTTFFIDSLSFLVMYYEFYSVYKYLNNLKKTAEKIICLCHCDVISSTCLEELTFLSSSLVKVLPSDLNNKSIQERHHKEVDIIYKKTGGKIISQKEIISLNDGFEISNIVQKKLHKALVNINHEMENLTTFKLGLVMNKSEKSSKNQLLLPYLRNEEKKNEAGDILYFEEVDDDPDDDLDI